MAAGKIPSRTIANLVFSGLILLLLKPAIPTATTYLFTKSYVMDDLKPVLSFMQENSQENDMAYLYHSAGGTYTYYAPYYDLENMAVINGQDYSKNAKRYNKELSSLPRGQRIWFVFSFVGKAKVSKGVRQDEREYILNFLKQNGSLLQEFYSTNNASSAHLFILR